jgi:hypothetical protein
MFFTKYYSMKKITSYIAILFMATITSLQLAAQTPQGVYTLSGNANGTQMIPSITGNGSATFTGTYDPSTKELKYTTNWNGLSGAPISGGFYNGMSGTAGTSISPGWTLGTDLRNTGRYTGTTTLTADQEKQLLNGDWYYSLGTATNSNGELRGQISAKRPN